MKKAEQILGHCRFRGFGCGNDNPGIDSGGRQAPRRRLPPSSSSPARLRRARLQPETYKVVRKPAAQPQPKVAVIRYADGMGRVYDVASKAWHDGQNHCWSGKLGWTFKNGAWSYGSYRWYRGGRHLAHQRAGGAEVRRLRDLAGVRRQGCAHRRSQAATPTRRSSPAPPSKAAVARRGRQLALPGRRQCGHGQRMQEVFPERRRNAACALHERAFVAIIGPPPSARL